MAEQFTPKDAITLAEAILEDVSLEAQKGNDVCRWCDRHTKDHHPDCPVLVAQKVINCVVANLP